MPIILKIENLRKIDVVAKSFVEKMGDKKVFAFNGKMGVGKTTFINAVCKMMGVTQIVNSPTFSIVNEYETASGNIIYHFDCYRIQKIQEALDLGAEEYLYSGNYCFIEWSENIAPILPDYIVNVDITELEDGSRSIQII
ncbi:MAG: tRNA (adenosine(37)-N6)-threonylcarbamoyltransferase complex ATPase subunit type 1 TsaE [Paludibacter sp.]|nr:tRNA (adenosine(37)-N6)-threonylcarbamoyltransferase complex ATPase subunit type 1 TsaE [Paludibacter sp.]